MILDSIKIKKFKAIRDSGSVKFGTLTAFIGNNGAGKSSLIEALETYQVIVSDIPCLKTVACARRAGRFTGSPGRAALAWAKAPA